MKKFVFLLSLVCLFAFSAFAQTPSFAGEWTLDKGKSKMDERMAAMIESRTMTVEQNDKEIKATTATKRNAPPNAGGGGGQGGPGGGGGGRGMGGFGGGDGTSTYTLDGKEVVTERETQMGKVPIKTTSKIKDGKLHIETSSTFNTPNGEMTSVVKSTWELSADGKTLTVKSTRNTPNGDVTTESVFTKKN